MQYLLTWIEGEEVFYRLVANLNFDRSQMEGKHLMITKLEEQEFVEDKITH